MGRAIANSNRNISVVGNRRHAYRTHKMHSAMRVARACDDASALLGARDPSGPAPAPSHRPRVINTRCCCSCSWSTHNTVGWGSQTKLQLQQVESQRVQPVSSWFSDHWWGNYRLVFCLSLSSGRQAESGSWRAASWELGESICRYKLPNKRRLNTSLVAQLLSRSRTVSFYLSSSFSIFRCVYLGRFFTYLGERKGGGQVRRGSELGYLKWFLKVLQR